MELNKKTIILLILSIYTVAMLVAAGFNLLGFKNEVLQTKNNLIPPSFNDEDESNPSHKDKKEDKNETKIL